MVYFAPHNSHNKFTDVYQPSLPVRVDKYVQMLAGIVTSAEGSTFKCAFPGRKQPGTWVLECQPKGFSGALGSRHFYNQMGGKVYEADFLLARRLNDEEEWPARLELHLPNTEKNIPLAMLVPKTEQVILEHALKFYRCHRCRGLYIEVFVTFSSLLRNPQWTDIAKS